MRSNTTLESVIENLDWQIAPEDGAKPLSLAVQQRRRAWVFPWHRFVWAEGDNSEVQIAFATHLIKISGHGLAALLAALATQRVVLISQPTESEATFREAFAGVNDISVQAFTK